MPQRALEPSSRWMHPIRRARRLAIPLGTVLALVAAIAADRAVRRDAAVLPIVVEVPAAPTAPATAPAVPAPAPAPAAPVAAPDEPAQACESSDESALPEQWTMSEDHFGPFTRCQKEIDLAFVRRVLPGYDVAEVPAPYVPEHHGFEVTQRGRPVLTIWPPMPGGGPGLQVEIHARAIETPWRVRVGDRVGTLAAHHRGLACIYGAAEGEEGLWCMRVGTGDGWRDTLKYTLDMRPLGKDRSLVSGEIDLTRIAHLRIKSITWEPASAAR